MADLKGKHLEDQLKRIGCNFRFWGRAEIRELADVLLPDEIVEHCVNGQYEGGFAMLVATDQRVLLIDKKPMYLTLEDIRFDMISEIDFNHRIIHASVFLCTPNKSLRFVAYNQARLRKLFHFVQTRVMEIRQHYQHQGQIWKDYAESLQHSQQNGDAGSDQPMFEPYFDKQVADHQTSATAEPNPEQLSEQAADTTVNPALTPPPMPFRTVAPIISAYTRLPMMTRQRRFLGSRAVNPSPPSAYYSGQQ